MRARDLVLAGLFVIGGAGLGATNAMATDAVAAREATGVVRVVHGLRGLVADVYLDDQLVLSTFRPERSTDPLELPAGPHTIEVRPAGASTASDPLIRTQVRIADGFQGTLIAHLDAAGAPTLSMFADDLSPVPAGQSRVVVRHVAAAGPIDVFLDGRQQVAALEQGTETAHQIGAGDYTVSVRRALRNRPIAEPEDVAFREGSANFMYLIGSAERHTIGWAAVVITDLQTAPAQIQTGDGSWAPADDGPGSVLVGAGLAGVVIGGAALVAGRRRLLGWSLRR
ncbi:MAG: DUF4397 domain-containing protein [Acidimicrobiia bacterium]|nr:DUF4397 domain-containing protein [Acidimicrobiia bacterium]